MKILILCSVLILTVIACGKSKKGSSNAHLSALTDSGVSIYATQYERLRIDCITNHVPVQQKIQALNNYKMALGLPPSGGQYNQYNQFNNPYQSPYSNPYSYQYNYQQGYQNQYNMGLNFQNGGMPMTIVNVAGVQLTSTEAAMLFDRAIMALSQNYGNPYACPTQNLSRI